MGHKEWMTSPDFSRWDRVKVKDSQAVAAGLWLLGGSMQCPTFAKNKAGHELTIR